MKVVVRPGVPFSARTRDKAANEYEVSGILHRTEQDVFELSPFDVEVRGRSGNSAALRGPLPIQLGGELVGEVGKAWDAWVLLTGKWDGQASSAK